MWRERGARDDEADLPDHEIVTRPRARRVVLRVRCGAPLLVTVPPGFPRRRVASVVRDAAGWIARTQARVEAQAAELAIRAAQPPGPVIELPGVGLRYRLLRRASGAAGVRAHERDDAVVLSGRVDDAAACRAALRRWVRRVAARELPALAASLADTNGCRPASIAVRWPRRRWGSCSARGSVGLSVDLVFLPRDLAISVILHELAHLSVMNHSHAFRRRLEDLDPAFDAHRRELRQGRDHIPGWALPDARP